MKIGQYLINISVRPYAATLAVAWNLKNQLFRVVAFDEGSGMIAAEPAVYIKPMMEDGFKMADGKNPEDHPANHFPQLVVEKFTDEKWVPVSKEFGDAVVEKLQADQGSVRLS